MSRGKPRDILKLKPLLFTFIATLGIATCSQAATIIFHDEQHQAFPNPGMYIGTYSSAAACTGEHFLNSTTARISCNNADIHITDIKWCAGNGNQYACYNGAIAIQNVLHGESFISKKATMNIINTIGGQLQITIDGSEK